MEKLPKSQLAKITLFFLLLLLTPFISTSLRPSYLYFLFNVLIIALGIDAGLLSAISGPREEKKPIVAAPVAQQTPPNRGSYTSTAIVTNTTNQLHERYYVKPALKPAEEKPRPKVLEKAAVVATTRAAQKALKRCPSRPSIFFIGACEGEGGVAKEEKVLAEEEEEFEVEVVGELSKQELFAKAETFIGNFYKQLKLQREESWKKIHGLYHRPF